MKNKMSKLNKVLLTVGLVLLGLSVLDLLFLGDLLPEWLEWLSFGLLYGSPVGMACLQYFLLRVVRRKWLAAIPSYLSPLPALSFLLCYWLVFTPPFVTDFAGLFTWLLLAMVSLWLSIGCAAGWLAYGIERLVKWRKARRARQQEQTEQTEDAGV